MSYPNRWCTKDDILKDLAQMTGRVGDVDDMYIVHGERPPPSRYEEDDDEFNLRFPHYLPESENIGPDLEGITKMLRMVNEPENADDDFRVAETDEIVVSKLDPNVPEFVPKGATASRKNNPDITINNNYVGKSNHNDKTKIINNSDVRSNDVDLSKVKDVKTKGNSEENDEVELKADKNDKKCDIDMNKRIDISKLDADQIKDITTKLKSKISDATKSGDLRSKREKNVAIATLLKLHSVTPRQLISPKHNNDNGDVKPLKLFPPEYFESSPAGTNSGTNVLMCEVHGIPVNTADSRAFETPVNGTRSTPVDSGSDSCIRKTPSKTGSTTIPDEGNSVLSIISPVSKSSDSVTFKEPDNNKYRKIEKPVTPKLEVAADNTYAANPDVQNSIKKVKSWFQKPSSPKPKELSVCLGPVSFKRKSSPIARSPGSDSDAASRRSTPSISAPQTAHYKPSKYAEDLSRKFAERGKNLEQQHQDMWTRLEIQLREKEEKMNKKAIGQQGAEENGLCIS